VALRIAFDLDGVLADMATAVDRERQFLERLHPVKEVLSDGTEETDACEADATLDESACSKLKRGLSARDQRRLWDRISAVENFWETLDEIEPGMIRALDRLAGALSWEIIFLTKRPHTAGFTAQVQSQRWLESHGFNLPSVFVVNGSRGKIAEALELDFVVDDLPANCVDVITDSKARAILVLRGEAKIASSVGPALGIAVVRSLRECFALLTDMDQEFRPRSILERVKWAVGLAARKATAAG
jgi:hypothetical protein